MRIRIDLKILIFLVLFYFTKQIDIYLTILFFCILHELGHIITGLALKIKPEKIELMPYGLSASLKIRPEDINKKIGKGSILEVKKVIISISGPLLSLILAIIFTYIQPFGIDKQNAVYSNILIVLFNLMPIYPLDGGRIIKDLLHIKFGNRTSKIVTNEISNVIMVLFTFVCSIAILYFKNIAYFFICVVLWAITIQENRKFKNDMKIYDYFKNE